MLAYRLYILAVCMVHLKASLSLAPAPPVVASKAASSAFSANVRTKEAIVVGGGPVGLATALTLSNAPHNYNVKLLEKSGENGVFDPTRSYLYNVNPRGLVWFDAVAHFSNVSAKLEERGSSPADGMGSIVYIPSDPTVPILNPTNARISGAAELQKRRNIWIPRHHMVQILEEGCRQQEQARMEKKQDIGSIEIVYGKEISSISYDDDDNMLHIKCVDGSSLPASLLVGADGMDSTIRSCLGDDSQSTWLQENANNFRLKRLRSPSTGLRMKSLQFPPGFQLTNTTGDKIETDSEMMYIFRGVNKGRRSFFSLGMLPIKDSTLPRAANINTRPDHEIWSITSGPEMKSYFEQNFPRVKWDELISDSEWERFANAKGTRYPFCQYSPGSAVASPDGLTGVCLVGDACHAFPPDIGQGINAGLQDVVALDRSLRGLDITSGEPLSDSDLPETLGAALLTYQANRGPEHKALARLAQIGAPYQYRQPWLRDKFGRFFWTTNIAFRLFLNKLSRGLIPSAAVMIMQQHDLPFRDVMRKAAITGRLMKLALVVALITRLVLKR